MSYTIGVDQGENGRLMVASLKEYYDTDFPYVLNVSAAIDITRADKSMIKVQARVHYDYNAGAKFISYFIPETKDAYLISAMLLKEPGPTLGISGSMEVLNGFYGETSVSSNDLIFVNRFFIYSESTISDEENESLRNFAAQNKMIVTFRSRKYAIDKSTQEKPLAFISHDSRDKDFARELAVELQKSMCPVWFDEFSLNVGDNLRESIEKGIRDCEKIILILSPSFLSNPGWTKVEFNSIFTRELVEGRDLILAVWKDVGRKEVYEYSPSLADRYALRESEGIANIASKLRKEVFKNQ